MSEDLYYHNKLMGRIYAEQDIRKIEALRGRFTDEEIRQAIQNQITQYEARLQEATEIKEKSGIAHYTSYLETFRAGFKVKMD
jgi:hypothetical protein